MFITSALLSCLGFTFAASDAAAPHIGIQADLEPREALPSDPLGIRSGLTDRGIEFNADLTMDWSRNFRGGRRTGSGFHHLFVANIEFDMDTLLDLPGGSLFVEFHANDGSLLSERLVGDSQIYSNISNERRTQIAELWYQQILLDDLLRIKIGKVDANTEFAFVEHGLEFLNSSMGFSPTIFVLPTYPDPATSINFFLHPHEQISVGFGLYDGAGHHGVRTGSRGPSTVFHSASDVFLIGEIGLIWSAGKSELAGRIGVGGWHHTGTFDRFDGGRDSGSSGFYLVMDQQLWQADPTDIDCNRGVSGFFQYGYADPSVSEFHHHVGGGVTWTGALPSRDADVIGLGATYVRFTNAADFVDHGELAVELFYQAHLTPWLIVQPDFQYIRHPGGTGRRDAVVGALRLGIVF